MEAPLAIEWRLPKLHPVAWSCRDWNKTSRVVAVVSVTGTEFPQCDCGVSKEGATCLKASCSRQQGVREGSVRCHSNSQMAHLYK
jgi:hypothetical protein